MTALPSRPAFDRVRLWAATVLTWIASRLAPRSMRTVFWGYGQLLAGFPYETEKGRTWGVIHAIWSRDTDGAQKALRLQLAAIKAVERERVAIESEDAA